MRVFLDQALETVPFSEGGIATLKENFRNLNKQISQEKVANPLPTADTTKLQETLASSEPQFPYLQKLKLKPVWEQNFGLNSDVIKGLDNSVQHAINLSTLKQRLAKAKDIHPRIKKKFKSI